MPHVAHEGRKFFEVLPDSEGLGHDFGFPTGVNAFQQIMELAAEPLGFGEFELGVMPE